MMVPDLDDALSRRLVRRFGEGILDWLEEAPRVLESLASRWRIEFGALIPRATMSIVVSCHTADGRDAVCKLSPDTARVAREAAALQTWTTPHTPTVYAADSDVGALLIEAIDPGTPLAEVTARPSVDAVARMLRSLHAHRSVPAGFPPLTDRIAWLFDAWHRELDRSPELLELIPADLPERGRRLAMRLAADPVPNVLLHADLNPGNVLDGGVHRGLVAIDPAPCIGDPAFDATDLVFTAATESYDIANYI